MEEVRKSDSRCIFYSQNQNVSGLWILTLKCRVIITLELHPVQSSIISTPLVRLHLRSESSDNFSWVLPWGVEINSFSCASGGGPVSFETMSYIFWILVTAWIFFPIYSTTQFEGLWVDMGWFPESDSMCRRVIAVTTRTLGSDENSINWCIPCWKYPFIPVSKMSLCRN